MTLFAGVIILASGGCPVNWGELGWVPFDLPLNAFRVPLRVL